MPSNIQLIQGWPNSSSSFDIHKHTEMSKDDPARDGDFNFDSNPNSEFHVVEAHVLQERRIGIFGSISLIVNKIIGAGIFSTPATIYSLSGSVGMALTIWVVAGLISISGSLIMMEFGSAIPRSGGIKLYLERSFSPKLLQTCVFLFYCVFLQVSASNAITCSSYLLLAGGAESTTWKLRGVAIASVGFAVGIHTVAPKMGRLLQDILSLVKLFILLFIVCTGFAALAGHLKVPDPKNLNVSTSFRGTSNSCYGIGTALLSGTFSFQGYDNVNAFAAVPKQEFTSSNITIAAVLFRNVFGNSAATKALPSLVALSALGHLLGIAFTVPRVIQELAKDGITPFPNLLMQNRPFTTPIAALITHLGVSILFICAPPAGDAFNFVIGLSSYPYVVLVTGVTIGLVKLRLNKDEEWTAGFSTPWIVVIFYLLANIVSVDPF
ncbi:uncharacterized protein N7503_000810 [Penicillium pulvis]|uniref:uncharacterized protein n=1 Tax=Penicillium pulvis TaxID=1562058 RepID=UPI0025473062|nr:uncharacterized protein N7503_000810 [Penicillium pulvis]KAJ5814060.1 hypothetical protein N7503_000810 [Penicillium pulvis]